MKKTIKGWGVFAVLLMLCLTGCHRTVEKSSFTVPLSFDTEKPVEISFWAKNDTNIYQTRIYEKAIEDFQSCYPNVTVKLRLYTDYGKIYNDVITNISTDTTPNVCITYPDHIATYMTGRDSVLELSELMEDRNYGFGGSKVNFESVKKEEIEEKFLEEGVIGGGQYALPFMRSTEACYVNKDLVEKLGYTLPEVLTWDFVWEVSEAALKKDAEGNFLVNGQKVMIPFIYKSTDNMMIQYLAQKNAPYSTEEGEIGIFNDITKAFLYEVGDHGASRAFSTFKISSYPGNFLNAGQCIFAVDSTAGATWMGSHAPLSDIHENAKVEFETVVYPVIQAEKDGMKMISQGPSLCLFNKSDPDEVMASWLFAQFLLTDEVQIAYSETEGYIPVTKKARESEAYKDYLAREGEDNREHYAVKIQAAKMLIAHIKDSFVTPVFNGSASLRDAAGQMIEEVVKSRRRKETVDEAYMEKLFADMVSLYRLERKNTGGAGTEEGPVENGPLPKESVLLLGFLVISWIFMGGVLIRQKLWAFFERKREDYQ